MERFVLLAPPSAFQSPPLAPPASGSSWYASCSPCRSPPLASPVCLRPAPLRPPCPSSVCSPFRSRGCSSCFSRCRFAFPSSSCCRFCASCCCNARASNYACHSCRCCSFRCCHSCHNCSSQSPSIPVFLLWLCFVPRRLPPRYLLLLVPPALPPLPHSALLPPVGPLHSCPPISPFLSLLSVLLKCLNHLHLFIV